MKSKASKEGRCFVCGSKEHRAFECPLEWKAKQNEKIKLSEKRPRDDNSQGGRPKGKGKGGGKGNAPSNNQTKALKSLVSAVSKTNDNINALAQTFSGGATAAGASSALGAIE